MNMSALLLSAATKIVKNPVYGIRYHFFRKCRKHEKKQAVWNPCVAGRT